MFNFFEPGIDRIFIVLYNVSKDSKEQLFIIIFNFYLKGFIVSL
jgi:hypothetical protein